MRQSKLLPAIALAVLSPGMLMAGNYQVTSALTQTIGPDGPAVTSSGLSTDGLPWNDGSVGRFIVTDSETLLTYGLEVTTSNPTGTLAGHSTTTTDTLMVARTSNSQGLTDQGTLSVFIWGEPSGSWSLDLTFTFYTNSSFDTLAPISLMLTSLDIDADQKYYTSNADFTANNTYPGTNLTAAPSLTGFTGFTATGSSEFNNARHAVSSTGTDSSFTVQVHNGGSQQALFMFEFRNPSSIVPEPGTAVLAGLGSFVMLGFLRRRAAR